MNACIDAKMELLEDDIDCRSTCLSCCDSLREEEQGWESMHSGGATIEAVERGEVPLDFVLSNVDTEILEQTETLKLALSLHAKKRKGQKLPDNFNILYRPDIFIFDSGCSKTASNHKEGMENQRSCATQIIAAQGPTSTKGSIEGDYPVAKYDKDDKFEFYTMLENVTYNPKNVFNLYAGNKAMEEGWTVYGNKNVGYCLIKDGFVVKFDIRISTKTSCIWAGCFKRLPKQRSTIRPEFCLANTGEGLKLSVNKAHELLGHPGEASTREGASAMGWILTRGSFKKCEHCARAKSRRKPVPQEGNMDNKATAPGERIFLDITSIRKKKKEVKTPFVS